MIKLIKQGLNAKLTLVSEVMLIVLDEVGIDPILLDPAVLEIFYFKHDERASLIIIFIGNPDIDDIGNAILVLS